MRASVRRLEAQYQDRIDFHVFDIDQPAAHELAERYGVAGIPAIVLLDAKGNMVKSLSGHQTEDQLTTAIEGLLAATSR